nr:immunoglobulin heavy chain junction region [Macaca mulatta]MOW46319.1 immunoglobulin heavy chain junction region [Macaca mulatta]MOW46801.1 immunoglobulin heavy chain junction region [Macaca mulatta]MOW46931.1 immunoglobulin heavy chain junction region [Macaca mulatta]MOW49662.1 immunoglobulin heavy chain junction region [Macaca mulatta]
CTTDRDNSWSGSLDIW